MQVMKQQLELDMEQWTGSKLGKEYVKAVYCPCLFNLYAEYIMQNAGLDEAQAGIKIARKNINNLRYAHDTTLKPDCGISTMRKASPNLRHRQPAHGTKD